MTSAGKRSMRQSIAILCLLSITACDIWSPTSPGPVDTQVTLAPGETAAISDASMTVTFEEVTADSRCPINALCVVAGSATVRIRIQGRGGEVRNYELQMPKSQITQYRTVTLELLALQPHPFAGHPTDPSEYRATIRVSR